MPSTQCNVDGDGEALSLATMKETEWLNHMRQYVEDHQQIDKEDMQPTVASKLEMEKPLAKTQHQWYHGPLSTENDRKMSTHDARVCCCLFLQKLLILKP